MSLGHTMETGFTSKESQKVLIMIIPQLSREKRKHPGLSPRGLWCAPKDRQLVGIANLHPGEDEGNLSLWKQGIDIKINKD